ncbi:DUF2752 domain-containing protein [Mycolicibacterium sp. 22603]|uniref:DUF2752 domain-containing protein n=1 Tax=Mycolicibacterium sp. 22603 TaxID=3453950 RepID=UPI003F846016
MAPSTVALGRAGVLGAGLGLAGALTYIGLGDPHRPGFFPACPFKTLTGFQCPACGGLRMTHDVLHGDLAAAVVDNVFMLVAIPMLLLWLAVRWRQGRRLMPPAATVTVVLALVAWTVVRNWPGFPLVPTVSAG